MIILISTEMDKFKDTIESAWQDLARGGLKITSCLQEAVTDVINKLDAGQLRVAEFKDGSWQTHQWIKQAILLSFRLNDNQIIRDDAYCFGYDKVPLKCASWQEKDFVVAGFRMVPGAVIRKSAYIGKNVILMPSFVNVGAYVGDGTMIDSWATVGSCAQIGKNCHISGGVGIGGVLEPIQANPVIIEDDVFIGARSEVAEGVIIEQGAVLSMGVYIGSSTRIYDRDNDKVIYGRVPAYSVVVPGVMPSSKNGVSTYAAIIVKQVDARTRAKTGINEILREM